VRAAVAEPGPGVWGARLLLTIAIAMAAAPAFAQRTEIVVLKNGDRITGEVMKLDRGQLEFKTDDAGTLYLEWDKLVSVTAATRVFEITLSDGRRFVGSLGPAAPRLLSVVEANATYTLTMADVTHISPIGRGFWSKLDGAISTGFNYTRSSGVAQLNVNANTVYRRPGFQFNITGSYTATATEDDPDQKPDDRGDVQAVYSRFLAKKLVLSGIGRFESNESLGLVLRTEVGAGIGPRLLDTNRAQFWFGAGVVVNHEQGVDVEPTQNVEAVLFTSFSYFTYDKPRTTIDTAFAYYPSFSDPGRQRIQFDAAIKREILKDLIVSLNFFDSFDNRPPNAAFDTNDLGIVLSIGWSF
jgi:Protein of unknown function, DUF481